MASRAALATKAVRVGYAKAAKCEGQDSCEPADHYQDALTDMFHKNVLENLHLSLEKQETYQQKGDLRCQDALNSVGFLGREVDLLIYTDRSVALFTDDGRGPADARVVRGDYGRILKRLILEDILAPLAKQEYERGERDEHGA